MNLSVIAREERLARALKLTTTEQLRIEYCAVGGKRGWWLRGCVEGDQPLPQTAAAHTVREALDMVEAWLAPEIDGGDDAG
jgi:hypothetical protein